MNEAIKQQARRIAARLDNMPCGRGWVGTKPPGCKRKGKAGVEKEVAIASKSAERPTTSKAKKAKASVSRDQHEKAVSDPDEYAKFSGVTLERAREMRTAMQYFTSVSLHEKIRAADKGEPGASAGAKKMADAVNEFIEKSPVKFDGPIYRGLNLATDRDKEKFLSGIKKGVTLDAMSSFSSRQDVAEDFAKSEKGGHQIILKVEGNKSGVSIKKLSLMPDEDEVLAPKGAKYKVSKVETDKDGRTFVTLKER